MVMMMVVVSRGDKVVDEGKRQREESQTLSESESQLSGCGRLPMEKDSGERSLWKGAKSSAKKTAREESQVR